MLSLLQREQSPRGHIDILPNREGLEKRHFWPGYLFFLHGVFVAVCVCVCVGLMVEGSVTAYNHAPELNRTASWTWTSRTQMPSGKRRSHCATAGFARQGGCGPRLMRLEIGSPSSSLVRCWIRIY